jgi:hypothetical protein
MEIFLKEGIHEIHSFDAYYKNAVITGDVLIIPYINLGVSEHPLNPSKELQYIDKAFIVFKEVCYLKAFREQLIEEIDCINAETYYFGGSNLDKESNLIDMEIKAKEAFLLLIEKDYNLSTSMWIPVNTPNFPSNMQNEEVEEFFNYGRFPIFIKNLINSSPPSGRSLSPSV